MGFLSRLAAPAMVVALVLPAAAENGVNADTVRFAQVAALDGLRRAVQNWRRMRLRDPALQPGLDRALADWDFAIQNLGICLQVIESIKREIAFFHG